MMTNNKNLKGLDIYTLTEEEVISLHKLLTENYNLLESKEPISPNGVKSEHMLGSAVARQFTGFGEVTLYDDPFSNCSTLVFGLVKNHPFHNGNKRAGFICMIKHLFENGYVLNVKIQNLEIYDFLLHLANGNMRDHAIKYYRKEYSRHLKEWVKEDEDQEIIKYMAFWMKRNSVPKRIYLKNDIKVNDLKRCLFHKGIELSQKGPLILLKEEKSLFKKIFSGVKKREYNLGNKVTVKKEIIAKIRKDFNLNEANGIDNSVFYSEDFIDEEIMNYKILISKLART